MDLFSLKAILELDSNPFVKGLKSAGDLMVAFASGVANFGKDVVKTGMGFDQQMSAVQAVLGKTEGTMENMERLREFGLDQARTSIFTAEDTAKAYYYMGMAGWKTEQMLAGLPGVMNLAAASGEDLARVSDIVTDSITAFGLSADDVTDYVNILAQTATNSNTDVARMGETFKYVAPVAGALGFSVEDVALSIGLLASAGIKGSQAGTTLRNIFTRIATNAGATSKSLGALDILTAKLGVRFYDAAGNARDWGDVLTELRTAWKGMGEEARDSVINEFNEKIGSGAEVDATIKDLYQAYKDLNALWKKAQGANDADYASITNQMHNIGSQYNDLLEMLDIPSPHNASE